MVTKVIKRDGSIEDFNKEKIVNAVKKAYINLNIEPNMTLVRSIATTVEKQPKDSLTIEEIQKIVESSLMKNQERVATAYIIYRNERDKQRRLAKTYDEIVEVEDSDIKNENANINGNTPAGQMMKFASVAANDYAENNLISKVFMEAQEDGYIHIHDKDYYGTRSETCSQIDLSKLFKDGFYTEHGFTREPNRLRTAIDLAAIALQTNQNEQHGLHCAYA